MDVLLIILALVIGLVGGLSLTQATLGVGIVAGACLLGIFARMAQAAQLHNRQVRMLSALIEAVQAIPPPAPAPVLPPPADTWLCFRCGQHVNGKHDACSACGLVRPGA